MVDNGLYHIIAKSLTIIRKIPTKKSFYDFFSVTYVDDLQPTGIYYESIGSTTLPCGTEHIR